MENYLNFQKGNLHKPNPFLSGLVLTILSLSLITGVGLFIPASVVFAETNLLSNISPEVLTTITNQERVKKNISILEQNYLLQKAAQLKVKDMITRGYFSHNTPDGKLPWYWLDQAGYEYQTAGENMAINFLESSEIGKTWMNSLEHRQNILSEEYTQVGTAVAHGIYEGKDTVFVVQLFGTPKKVSSVQESIPEVKTSISPVKKGVVKPAKKIIISPKDKIVYSEKPFVLAQKPTKVVEYPYLYYTRDNGFECVLT